MTIRCLRTLRYELIILTTLQIGALSYFSLNRDDQRLQTRSLIEDRYYCRSVYSGHSNYNPSPIEIGKVKILFNSGTVPSVLLDKLVSPLFVRMRLLRQLRYIRWCNGHIVKWIRLDEKKGVKGYPRSSKQLSRTDQLGGLSGQFKFPMIPPANLSLLSFSYRIYTLY